MSLIRQIWLLLGLTLALAFVGATGLTIQAARHALGEQIDAHSAHVARTVAEDVRELTPTRASVDAAIAREVQMGGVRRIEVANAAGAVVAARQAPAVDLAVPAWFVSRMGVVPHAGTHPVRLPDGTAGQLRAWADDSGAQEQLWSAAWRVTGLMLVLSVVVCALAWRAVARLREPLEATVAQARAIAERQFIRIEEPDVPELRDMAHAMNAMVDRLQTMFGEQAKQIDQLRRQAHCDPVTGLSNREHFIGRLRNLLQSETGSAGGGVVMVRLGELQLHNRNHGRAATDAMLRDAAAALIEAARRAPASEVGRLNGSDFALVLPDVQSLRDPAMDVAARLRQVLAAHDQPQGAVVSAVRWWHGSLESAVLAAADQALARAEARGPYAVELSDSGDASASGEETWRHRLQDALNAKQGELMEFDVVGVSLEPVHRECPLRLRLAPDGQPVPAAQWLPMAKRAHLMPQVDAMAIELALHAVERDGKQRAINISPTSLADATFVPRVREILNYAPQLAPALWFELADSDISRQVDRIREFTHQVASFGARVGLEHVGERISDLHALLEVGLDFVKLHAALTDGISRDKARAEHIAATVRVLHGIGVEVYAVAVTDMHDAAALWQCGINGLTGPVVPRLLAARADATAQ